MAASVPLTAEELRRRRLARFGGDAAGGGGGGGGETTGQTRSPAETKTAPNEEEQKEKEREEGGAGESGVAVRRGRRQPPTTHVNTEGVVVRRPVDSDNNCLFTSLGYVLEDHNLTEGLKLRKVIATTVKNDPVTYNEVFLEKSNAKYVEWISNSSNWGGAIELSILSDYYETEIAVFDIQTGRTDIYGQGKHYPERVLLIYDGIHYDPLALTFEEGLPKEMDVTVFSVSDEYVMRKAQVIAQDLQKKKQFVDTGNFTLRCLVCSTGLVGQKEAVEHAKLTGHTNFGQT
ncbi:Ubiquitin thioesterase OTU1 [Balamuthia mandrillaris]